MGKSLVIKGADFSNVSVASNVDITSTLVFKQGYFNFANGQFNNVTFNYCIFPTVVGEKYQITAIGNENVGIVSLDTDVVSSGDLYKTGLARYSSSNVETHIVTADRSYIGVTTSDVSVCKVIRVID